MEQRAREEILGRLKSAPKKELSPRPVRPVLKELALDKSQLIEMFSANFVAETGILHRTKDYGGVLKTLSRIAEEEGLKKVMAATDPVVAALDLPTWGQDNHVQIMTPRDFTGRDSFRDAVFLEADGGITGVDFAVAESGTLGLIHNKDQARLISLAPILHIAVVPVNKIIAVYEQAMEKIFGPKENPPGQFCFITGPSMTGDIQGVLFKGMHGPRKLIAILVG